MNAEINSILENQETITWQGKISRKPLMAVYWVAVAIILIVSIFLFSQSSINYTSNGKPSQASGVMFGFLVLIGGIGTSSLALWAQLVKEYAITSKRVLIKSGIIGTDFKSIYFNEIKNIMVDVGVVGKIFSVGTIKIDLGRTETYSSGGMNSNRIGQIRTRAVYDNLTFIESPYEIYKVIQSALSGRLESLYSGKAGEVAQANPAAPVANGGSFCQGCGTAITSEMAFCGKCGNKLK
jgi:membrane protein YdbS with pleckstrin-like domain